MPKFVVIERLGSSSCRNSHFHSKFSSSSKSSRKLHRSSRIFHNPHPRTHCYNLILLLTFFIVSNINLVVCLASSSNGTQGNEPNATTLIRKTTVGTTKRTLSTNLTTEKPRAATTTSGIANANSLDACYASVRLTANNRSLQKESPFYSIPNNSLACLKTYQESIGQDDQNLPPCQAGTMNVYIGPEVASNVGNTFPHVRLNISATVFEQADSVVIRLKCLYAPDNEDTYCHDSSRMIVNGQWIWPCRSIIFERPQDVQIPFRFGFGCFRMYGMSQYLISVTLLPQKCRSSIYVSSPQDMQLFPEIAHLYKHDIGWSPMLLTDLSDEDGIWVRVNGPTDYIARRISIIVFQRLGNSTSGSLSQVATFDVEYPNGGVKWHNVPKGEYMLYAFVPRHDCLLVCEQTDSKCIVCPHTHINMTISEDRLSFAWKSLKTIRDAGPMFLLGILVSCALVLVFGSLYIFRQRRRAATRTCDLQLMYRPSVLLVYSDDHPIHSSVIASLARVLTVSANANVHLDQNELIAAGMQPSRWLVDNIANSSRVLLVLSPCTTPILTDSLRLSQRRPYPDLFVPAFDIIVRECTRNPTAARSRIAVLKLPYSPQTPSQIDILGLPEFKLPSEFARLTTFIHQLDSESPVQLNLNQEALNSFENGITDMETMMRREPNWIEQRREIKDASPTSGDIPAENPLAANHVSSRELTGRYSDRNEADERFALLPPDDDDNQASKSGKDGLKNEDEFDLLPPDDDD
ncbi:hypothetical protein WR25_11375 [Diploscapter pachys]|uniref:SEFIR domain-containing protein n=1 Tax=Diploscapter pachys TaxID=2018661 RepID=A0A2A2LJI8_9BILA|nr:hypothetical protein WR25_11375 [Diploscapter pachys]